MFLLGQEILTLLMFAVIFFFFFFNSPNFFILDEPTNHLDMETIEALGKSLHKFQVRNGIGIHN